MKEDKLQLFADDTVLTQPKDTLIALMTRTQ